jgi:hypothetical protein
MAASRNNKARRKSWKGLILNQPWAMRYKEGTESFYLLKNKVKKEILLLSTVRGVDSSGDKAVLTIKR